MSRRRSTSSGRTQWLRARTSFWPFLLASSGNTINNVEKAVVAAYPGSIMSQSFGIPEQFVKSGNNAHVLQSEKIYAAARAAGITALASTGDFGADERRSRVRAATGGSEGTAARTANAGYPASSPNVTAVGGTQGNPYFNGDDPNASPPPTCQVDVRLHGGPRDRPMRTLSGFVCRPSGTAVRRPGTSPRRPSMSQPAAPRACSSRRPPTRRVSDRARRRERFRISRTTLRSAAAFSWACRSRESRAASTSSDGTSAGSPQMAAVVALANQARANQGRGSLGFLNDKLYGACQERVDLRFRLPRHHGWEQPARRYAGRLPRRCRVRHRDGLGYAERRESRRGPGCSLSQPRL